MSLIGPKTQASWYEGELLGGVIPTVDGGLELALLNRWPDWVARELGGASPGIPAGWECPLPDETTHYHVSESRPGKRTEADATPEEREPPRADTMTRQSPAPVPIREAWEANQPRVDGLGSYARRSDPHAADVEPLGTPEVEVITGPSGYAGGTTGVLWALRTKHGRTTCSGAAWVVLAEGEGYRLYLPEGLRGGALGPLAATHFEVYQTLPNQGVGSARLQKAFPLDEVLASYVEMLGPYRDDGKKPATTNESGIGKPPEPGGSGASRNRAVVRRRRGRFDLQPGRYRFGEQRLEGGGLSLVSGVTREIVVQEKEKDTALVFEPARAMPKGQKSIPWVYINDVPHRAYRKAAGFSPSEAYGSGAEVEIYGYAPDAEPAGLRDGLYQTDPPDPNDPSSDTTAVEPPDPNTPPDEPIPIGVSVERGQPSQALVAVSGITRDGQEAARSAPARIALGNLQTYRVRPQAPVGKLANAEFSIRTPDGKPSSWTLLNLPAGRFSLEDGTLTMLQPVTIGADFPTARGRAVPVTPDTKATFVGAVGVKRRTTGQAQLAVEELNDAGAVVRTTVLKGIAGGRSTLGPRGFLMGPGAGSLAWHADASSMRYVARMALGADASVNLDMYVEDLDVFLFGAGLRKFARLQDGSVTFEPSHAVPYQDRSFFAVGECPIPGGGSSAGAPSSGGGSSAGAPDPALSRVSFDSGAFDPTPPASAQAWTQVVAGGAVELVSAAAAIHGPFGIEVKSDNTGAVSYDRRTYDAGSGRTSLAIRQPVRCVRKPSRGAVNLNRVADGQDRVMAVVRHDSVTGDYYVVAFQANGSEISGSKRTVIPAGTLGVAYDVELLVDVSGGAKNGVVSVAGSYFGSPREILATVTGLDFTERTPRYASALVTYESNSQAVWTYHIDEIVVTPGGDITGREAPAPPAGGEAPPPPDAPPDASVPGAHRLYHKWGERIRQSVLFLRPGTRRGEYGPRTDEPIPVKPGQDFTLSVFSEHFLIGADAEMPANPGPFGVVLSGPGKEPLELGSPYGSAFVGESPWQEWWKIYSVPERTGPDDVGYIWADIVSSDMPGVYYLYQEGLFADGALNIAADREIARSLARKMNGGVRVTMDTRAPKTVFTPRPYQRRRWAVGSPGVKTSRTGNLAELPPGVGLQNIRYRSGPTKAGPWTPEFSDPALVPEDGVLQAAFGLVSDGVEDVEVPPGGVFVETVPEIALLLDDKDEDLPGLGVIGELLPSFSRSDYAVKTVNGRPFAASVTDEFERLPGFAVSVYTEDAARRLLEANPNDRFRIRDPFARNGEGRNFLVRLADVLEIDDRGAPTAVDEEEELRRVFASFAVPWAYVEEAAPLPRPREHL